jgi:hypothetical protein
MALLGHIAEASETSSWSAAWNRKTHLAASIGLQTIGRHCKHVRFVNALEQEKLHANTAHRRATCPLPSSPWCHRWLGRRERS